MHLYSRQTIDHFTTPRLEGPLVGGGAAGEASAVDRGCVDHARFEVRIVQGRLAAVAQTTDGCVAVIAGASFLAEAVDGAPVAEAGAWTATRLMEAMGGMPARHLACLEVPIAALGRALEASQRV